MSSVGARRPVIQPAERVFRELQIVGAFPKFPVQGQAVLGIDQDVSLAELTRGGEDPRHGIPHVAVGCFGQVSQ